MTKDILGKIFGSEERPKIIRLFVFNPNTAFELPDVVTRSQSSKSKVAKEIRLLKAIGLIKNKTFFKEFNQKKKGGMVVKRKKVSGFMLNQAFPSLAFLRDFIMNMSPINEAYITEKLSGIGRLKLVMITGVFIQNWDSRLDMLVVADTINNKRLEKTIKSLEAMLGVEIRYAALLTKEFQYRMGMNDRLVRDAFDYSHKIVLDKLGIGRTLSTV